VSVLIAPARAHTHLREAAAETALLLAKIMTALEPAVRNGLPREQRLSPPEVHLTLRCCI
jgi:hypothetical protein